MKIVLFAAVPEEVGTLTNITHFSGIGRENATRTMVQFMEQHRGEPLHILNIGTVGSHDKPVGTLLRIKEIISAGEAFNEHRMVTAPLPFEYPDLEEAVLYSSDCFVSTQVFTPEHLDSIKKKADCFDMESAALYTVAQCYGVPYSSIKIVSDNLNVTIDVWRERLIELSKKLAAFVEGLELGANYIEL